MKDKMRKAEQGVPDREKSRGTSEQSATLEGTIPCRPGTQGEAGAAKSSLGQQDKVTRDLECHSRTQGPPVAEE